MTGTPPNGAAPIRIEGGNNNRDAGVQGVTNISRSDSIVTVPVYRKVEFHGHDLLPAEHAIKPRRS